MGMVSLLLNRVLTYLGLNVKQYVKDYGSIYYPKLMRM